MGGRGFPEWVVEVARNTHSGGRSGRETVYIDLEANKIAIETSVSTTFRGVTDTDKTLRIYDGKVAYSADLDSRQAIRLTKKGDILSEIFGEENILEYYAGETPYLGKNCKIYEVPQGKIYFWQGIVLKEELTVPLMGIQYTKEAKSIDLNVSIPREKFRLPSGVKVIMAQ